MIVETDMMSTIGKVLCVKRTFLFFLNKWLTAVVRCCNIKWSTVVARKGSEDYADYIAAK